MVPYMRAGPSNGNNIDENIDGCVRLHTLYLMLFCMLMMYDKKGTKSKKIT